MTVKNQTGKRQKNHNMIREMTPNVRGISTFITKNETWKLVSVESTAKLLKTAVHTTIFVPKRSSYKSAGS